MRRQYLGDSYDAVKRLWQGIFAEWAPLLAEPRFIPEDIRHEFTSFTLIPVLTDPQPANYSIFNDPDTGIHLPDCTNKREAPSHINLATIAAQLRPDEVRCVITFDQSHYRKSGFSHKDQRNAKVQWLERKGLHAFYYVSHAPFLFAFSSPIHMEQARNLLRNAGVPEGRIKVPE